ncbi:hypothetical protein GPX89_16510 [Nocardia sp. ET3-3]|uniref:Novel STAND NTPase 1 domain-containing protein n=1 Tax=Nocardia terrae TaxID=2675851 RepID=A0A7K1UX11_9NOCA|nr:WD40 repeat domain-containing protein [Nocardia terrae]MVU78842.1 hypothetical protein [Nocardia terrae]
MSGDNGDETTSPRALFAQSFTELYAAAGNPTLRRVADAAETRMRAAQGNRPGGASAQRISDWKAGRNVPARFESLLPVVLTLIDLARKKGAPLPRPLTEPKEWQRLWHAATTWNPETDSESACPYLGLAAYRGENRALYFGRTRATTELTDLVRETTGLIAVVGASGAGKSSLLAAGLAPALSDWDVTALTPGAHPLEALLTATATLVPRTEGPRRLLIIDQFEELFTTCQDEHEREEFLTALDRCSSRTDDPIAVVIALRADFYAHCLNYLALQDALEHRSYLLGPMRVDELAQAIAGPARAVGLELETGLEELVITELCGAGDHHGRRTYDPGALPLLSHVMAATWQHREGRRLTITGYRRAGGVVGSVAETAEYAWNELTPAQQSAAKEILLGLVTVGQDTQDTRRPAQRNDLLRRAGNTEDALTALELLSRTRLISLDAEAVNLSHEIVLTAWPRLRTWIDEDRVGYLVRQRLETDAAEWAAQDRDSSLLYQGTRLDNALDHVDPPPVGPLATEFLTTAATARKKSRRRATWLRARLALLGVAILIFAFSAYNQSRLADQRTDDKNFAAVLTEADRVRQIDPSLAAQLDLVAFRMRPDDNEVRSRLLRSEAAPLVTVTSAHRGSVAKVIYRSDGKLLASFSYLDGLRLWDVANRQHPSPVGQLLSSITDAAFSADGMTMATSSIGRDGPKGVTLWDISKPDMPRRLVELSDGISGHSVVHVAFAPAGSLLAVLSGPILTLWDVSTPSAPVLSRSLPVSSNPSADTGYPTFSPNGRLLALAQDDGRKTLELWDVAVPTNPVVRTTIPNDFRGHTLAFSPDNALLALADDSSTYSTAEGKSLVRIWDIGDPNHPRASATLSTGAPFTNALAFAPAGRVLATGNDDGIRLWNITALDNPTPLGEQLSLSPTICSVTGESDACRTGPAVMSFSPDGSVLTSGSVNGDVHVWSLPPATLTGQSGAPAAPVFYSAGKRLATASGDGRIDLWDIETPLAPVRLGEYRADPGSKILHPSPEGDALLVTSYSGPEAATHYVLDITDPAHIRRAYDWQQPVTAGGTVAISPDWHRLAVTTGNTVQLWDLSDRTHPTAVGTTVPLVSTMNEDIAFVADGTKIAIQGMVRVNGHDESVVVLWDVADPAHPRQISELVRQTTPRISELAFTRDGKTMLVIGDNTFQTWDISNPAEPARLGGPVTAHTLQIAETSFTADSRTLLTAGGDGEIQLWDFTDRSHPHRTETPTVSGPQPWATTISDSGRYLAAATGQGTIRLWDNDIHDAISRICTVTGSLWTEDLWHHHLPQLAYHPPCPAN